MRFDLTGAFKKAHKETLEKENVLASKQELVLLELVLAEIGRKAIANPSAGIYLAARTVFDPYLRKGFVTFRDLGISDESKNFFMRHNVLTPQMLRELEGVSDHLVEALFQGEDRRYDHFYRVYIPLTHQEMFRCGN